MPCGILLLCLDDPQITPSRPEVALASKHTQSLKVSKGEPFTVLSLSGKRIASKT